jgi:3'(2'),5'-bisphosphate nucleotidase
MAAYAREHEALLPVVREAGKAVMQFFTGKSYEVKHKDPENPVTEADFAANRILVGALRDLFPGDAILSEESDSESERAYMQRERFEKKRVWVIDPIDGTREFIKGREQFAVSLGLVENELPVLGFIYNPARGYLMSGGVGLGLFSDGKAFAPSPRAAFHPPDSLPKLVVSRSEQKNGHLQHLERHYGDLAENALGSIAYKLALVADGTYDLAVSVKPKNEWDIAGGAALLAAADLCLWEGSFAPVKFNKPQTESLGLVAGTLEACGWYKSIVSP